MAPCSPEDSMSIRPTEDRGSTGAGRRPDDAPRIVGLGVACLDYLFRAPLARPGSESPVSESVAEGGGLVATALVAAARLGARTEIRTWIGDDEEGRLVLAGLEIEGIDVTRVRTVPGARTPVSFIHVAEASGDRTIYHRRGPRPPTQGVSEAVGIQPQYDAALVDAVWPEASLPFARAARKAGIPVVADFCPQHGLQELAASVDALIVPKVCALGLSPRGDWKTRLEALANLGPSIAVITAGAEGCYYLDQGDLVHQPPFPVEVVDTTGAGDVFHGAFAYGLAAHLRLPECIRLASAVAALSCRALGGRPAIPTYQEASEFLRSL
jgi:sulfofructose kinase